MLTLPLKSAIATTIIAIVMVIAILFILPSLALTYYPAFFRGEGVWESIIEGFRLGFKYWGSTLGTILIAGIITILFTYLFQLPYQLWILLSGGSGIITYILALLSSMATLLVTPLTFIFLAFQYFSITEKEEGVSLQSKVEEFDNL